MCAAFLLFLAYCDMMRADIYLCDRMCVTMFDGFLSFLPRRRLVAPSSCSPPLIACRTSRLFARDINIRNE